VRLRKRDTGDIIRWDLATPSGICEPAASGSSSEIRYMVVGFDSPSCRRPSASGRRRKRSPSDAGVFLRMCPGFRATSRRCHGKFGITSVPRSHLCGAPASRRRPGGSSGKSVLPPKLESALQAPRRRRHSQRSRQNQSARQLLTGNSGTARNCARERRSSTPRNRR